MDDHRQFHTFRGYQMQNLEHTDLTPSMEDYLEMIYRECLQHGYARINQLAEQLHVRASSTTKTVQKLAKLELVQYEKYGIIQLTQKGGKLGAFLLHRHKITEAFLKKLGLEETLLQDTEMIEHQMSRELVYSLEIFLLFLQKRSDIMPDFQEFKKTYPLFQPQKPLQ